MARIWRDGCIIRPGPLDLFTEEFARQKVAKSLMFLPPISALFRDMLPEILVPTMASGLSWFDGLCASRCGAELIQAQRDLYGHQGFERIGPGRWHIE